MKVQKLSRSAKDKIAALALLASKDMEGAAIGLHSTAARATELLTLLCREKPALFTGIAQENFSWPLMYDPHPEGMRENAAFVESLKLGTQTQVNLSSGKTFSWRVPANVVAIHLHRAVRSLRRAPMSSWTGRDWISLAVSDVGCSSSIPNSDEIFERQLKALEEWGQRGAGSLLPPLSKNTATQWARATAELFRIAYGDNFEEHPKLQELKRSVLLRAKDGEGHPGGHGVVRAAMLKAIKQAWTCIAAVD